MRRHARLVSFALLFATPSALGCESSEVGGRDAGRDDASLSQVDSGGGAPQEDAGRSDGDGGAGDNDAGGDAGSITPRSDECGNGIDDDGNGRIDDGCVCTSGDHQACFTGAYRVGACRAGTQWCLGTFALSDWGEFPCVGETLPTDEICDGIDNDCDGTRDEGCLCDAGATRACGEEFTEAACMPGTQTCRGGMWSSCEGAIGPSAEVCTDMVDNDCDGTVNEGCACVSTIERCDDLIDNDCDGEVDEVIGCSVWGPEPGSTCPELPPTAGAPCEGGFGGNSCGYGPYHSSSVTIWTCTGPVGEYVWQRPRPFSLGRTSADPDPATCPRAIPEQGSPCSIVDWPPVPDRMPLNSGVCAYHVNPNASLIEAFCGYCRGGDCPVGEWVWQRSLHSY